MDGKLTMVNESGKMYVPFILYDHDNERDILLRIGFTFIRGHQPYSGFQTYIGGKQVELDCQIHRSQFPGFGNEGDGEFVEPDLAPDPVKTSINAKSFYGISKPKPAGPM